MNEREKVYFFKAGGLVKIGTTSGDVHVRAAQLQTGCPHRIEVLGFIWGGHDREAKIHRQFRHLHVQGEWFFASATLQAAIETLVDSQAELQRELKIQECVMLREHLETMTALTAAHDDYINLANDVLNAAGSGAGRMQ